MPYTVAECRRDIQADIRRMGIARARQVTLRTCLAMPVPDAHIEVMMRELDLTDWERGEWRRLILGADHE